jgi:hypothetical protein
MAQLPELVKIILEDVPSEQRNWFGKVADSVNKFLSSVVYALNGRLELERNIQCQVKSLEFLYTASTFPMKFKCTLPVRPSILFKGNIKDISNPPTDITAAVDVDWEYTASGEMQINNVTGLTLNQKYRLTVVVF